MCPCRPPSALAGFAAAGALRPAFLGVALERGEEIDQRRLLVFGQAAERRHRRRRVLERAADRALLELVADVGEMGPWAVIAVLADLVAGQAAGLGGDELALLQVGGDRH